MLYELEYLEDTVGEYLSLDDEDDLVLELTKEIKSLMLK